MAGIKSYANISGLDNTLLMIEGRFNLGMDERVLNVTGEFAKQMDMAAQKVFKGMAVGAETRGLRALPVMGTNLSTPSFLVDVPADQSWRPLNQKYKNRKKSLVSKGRLRTVNMWEYSGSLKRIFQKKSAQLTKISGNTFGNKNFFNTDTNTYDSKRISAKKASDRMFMTIPLPLIYISEPTRQEANSYAVFRVKKKNPVSRLSLEQITTSTNLYTIF